MTLGGGHTFIHEHKAWQHLTLWLKNYVILENRTNNLMRPVNFVSSAAKGEEGDDEDSDYGEQVHLYLQLHYMTEVV